jgi:hypothetical protein
MEQLHLPPNAVRPVPNAATSAPGTEWLCSDTAVANQVTQQHCKEVLQLLPFRTGLWTGCVTNIAYSMYVHTAC